MPSWPFATAAVPAAFVPMSLPSTRQDASMSTPSSVFPEMTLPAPVVVPPIVAPEASTQNAVIAVRHGGGAGLIRADVVALDQAATHRCKRRRPCFRR